MRRVLGYFLALTCLGISLEARAATVTYSFEAPIFALNESTALLSRAPNIGSGGFLADFTSSPSANGFSISTLAVSPLFSGQNLRDPFPPAGADGLTITLNMPITSVQVDFALFSPNHLTLSSAAGTTSALVLAGTQWGTLSFSSATPFTQFTLQGFDNSNQPTQLAIDNLVMTIVPEPATSGLLCAGLGLLVAIRRLRRGR